MTKLSVRKLILVVITALLLLLPIIIQKNLYVVGGDDTRLYYIFPEKFLNNFALNIISDNALGGANTGYNTAQHFIPFLIAISVIKTITPFVNTQSLMYGLNYTFAFAFFYLFLSVWIKGKDKFTFCSKIVASIFYVFSPFLVGTLYKNQLISVYLISLMPAILYLFTKGVLQKKYVYSIAAGLVFSIFSTTLNTLPWSLPIAITGIPYFAYLFMKNKKSFLINASVLTCELLVLNSFWLFHFLNSSLNNTGVASSTDYYSTDQYKTANIEGITNLTRLMNPLVPVLTKVDYNFIQNFSFTDIRNILFIFVIVAAGTVVFRTIKYKSIYIIAATGFLLSWFLFSPNFGNWGPDYFVKFVTTFPFGIMFRNMFDKFALPLAFYYAFAFSIALVILGEVTRSKYIKVLFSVASVFVIVSGSAFFFKQSVGERPFSSVTGVFNKDFMDLSNYLQKMENKSHILWLPITAPNFVSVEDEYLKGHYYSGLSPLRIIANRADYAGRYSFLIPADVYYGDKVFDLLKEKRYQDFGREMQKMNAEFIILDNQEIPEIMRDYLYDQDRKYLHLQGDDFKKILLGDKIADFGKRYSLYKINNTFTSDKFFLSDSQVLFPESFEGLTYKKISSAHYSVQINNLEGTKNLIFMEPYYKDWRVYLTNNNTRLQILKNKNRAVFGWANNWEINANEIKSKLDPKYYQISDTGGLNLTFEIYFEPEKYNKYLYPVSIVGYILSSLLLFWKFVPLFGKKKR